MLNKSSKSHSDFNISCILFHTKLILVFFTVSGIKHQHFIGRNMGEKESESVRETRRSKKLVSGHIHEKQYACFPYPWQPYAMN